MVLGGGGGEGEGDFRKLVAAESSAYPIPDAKFPYAISHFIYVILIPLLDFNSCFSILYTLSPANQLGNRLFYFVSLHPLRTLLPALLGSSHVNSHTLVHPKTHFGQYN